MRRIVRWTSTPTARSLALILGVFLALPCVASAADAPNQSGGLPALAAQVAALEEETADQAARIALLEEDNAALQSETADQAARIAELETEAAAQDDRIALLENDNAELQSVLAVDPDGDLVISGANLRIVSGAGSTSGPPNGRGNVIIGYDESNGDTKSGSHNLVIGPAHTYTSYGGLVAGSDNQIDAPSASVTGGTANRAGGFAASVSGGSFNVAVGSQASVSGGNQNIASGVDAAVGGGLQNTAAGPRTSVSGGFNCARFADNAWGSGTSLGHLGVFPVGVTSAIFVCP